MFFKNIKEGKDEEFYQEARLFIMDRISTISCYFIIDISNEVIGGENMRYTKMADIDTLLKVYYENPELGTSEIKTMFPGICNSTVYYLKKAAQEIMVKENMKSFRAHTVNTECAYKAWGIDVEDLEKRRAKLRKLGLV